MQSTTTTRPAAIATRLETAADKLDEAVRREARAQAWNDFKAALLAPRVFAYDPGHEPGRRH